MLRKQLVQVPCRLNYLLKKEIPFSWFVSSKNSATSDIASSETWRFYNSGFQTTYAPFPAEIIEPKPAAKVFKDINNEVTLRWSGVDIDDDIVGYEVYFSHRGTCQYTCFFAYSR